MLNIMHALVKEIQNSQQQKKNKIISIFTYAIYLVCKDSDQNIITDN